MTCCPWLAALPLAADCPETEEADPLAGGLRVPAFPRFSELERTDRIDEAELDLPKCGTLEVLGNVNLELDKLATPELASKTRPEKFARVLFCF